jgi:hypothetical protein
MADRFCEIFDRRMKSLQYHRPLSCGQGIARGTIEGFYPESGPKFYDLRSSFSDDPIMLATRYEQLRKVILSHIGQTGNIVIVAEQVFLSLSSDRRRLYTPWDLSRPDSAIRDDPSARVAYYRLIPPAEVPC